MDAQVTVWRRRGRLLLETLDRTAERIWLSSGGRDLGEALPAAELGAAVRAGLAATTVLDHPLSWPTDDGPVPGIAGARSWTAFASCAASVSVAADDAGRVTVTPEKRSRRGASFTPVPERGVTLPQPLPHLADEILGAAVLDALAASQDDVVHTR